MCEIRTMTNRVYGRAPANVEMVSHGPAQCTTVIGFKDLPTFDKHGQDFENIYCSKDCVLEHSKLDGLHSCNDHVVADAMKFIDTGSDKIIPEWRELFPAWALEQAGGLKGDGEE